VINTTSSYDAAPAEDSEIVGWVRWWHWFIVVALGATWKPSDTNGGGTLHWASPSAPGTAGASWALRDITAEPTLHRIRWANVDGTGDPELIVAPLHGRGTSPLIHEPEGVVLDDNLHFTADGQFSIVGRRGRVVKIEDKRISLDEIEQRLLALDGICDAAALAVTRGGRQAIGVLLVLSDEARMHRESVGKNAQESAWRRALRPCLEPVAVPRYWRIVDEIPVNSMNKRVTAQLQELFHEDP